MCGFVGWVNVDPEKPVDRDVLLRMNRTLSHRGPDDEGCFVLGNVGIAQRRLSIVDLSERGRQPLFNEDGTILAVCNGEIYNYPTLKKELVDAGHRFFSGSDTEAIVHAYEQWDIDFVSRLDGMFSLVLYDTVKSKMVLAKDPFGKKPLYYTLQNGVFLFGSEPKAFFANPSFEARLNLSALRKYLACDFVPSPESIYARCGKLPAGHAMVLDPKRLTSEPVPFKYWSIAYEPKLRIDMDQAVEEMVRLLRESLRKRLMSDVPLGVFLSGGLDSSTLVALLTDLIPPETIRTFNISFSEPSFDESPYAKRVAGMFGTDHHEQVLSPSATIEIFPAVIAGLDEPFADPSILPTYLLCAFARKHITVALGGDGGDELFAGYDPFAALRFSRLVERLPQFCVTMLQRASGLLPHSERNMSLQFKVHHFLKGFEPYSRGDPQLRNTMWIGSFPPEAQQRILLPEIARDAVWEQIYQEALFYRECCDASDPVDCVIDNFIKLYLHDDILVKVDRASMMNSLEVRSPFLDREFAEFVARLPADMKMKGGTRKYLLRRAMRGRLPETIVARGKKGFGIPTAAWLRGPLRDMLTETLAPVRLKEAGIFRVDKVTEMVNRHVSSGADFRKEVWALFVFELWRQRYLPSP
ncbi:MAG: asparagine synthase (glutamine-hydrolyzing) [Thermodesulfobacteriota bacterium]